MTKRLTQVTSPSNSEDKLSLRTTPGTKESGYKEKTSDREKESKSGLMDPCTKGGGKKTKRTARED